MELRSISVKTKFSTSTFPDINGKHFAWAQQQFDWKLIVICWFLKFADLAACGQHSLLPNRFPWTLSGIVCLGMTQTAYPTDVVFWSTPLEHEVIVLDNERPVVHHLIFHLSFQNESFVVTSQLNFAILDEDLEVLYSLQNCSCFLHQARPMNLSSLEWWFWPVYQWCELAVLIVLHECITHVALWSSVYRMKGFEMSKYDTTLFWSSMVLILSRVVMWSCLVFLNVWITNHLWLSNSWMIPTVSVVAHVCRGNIRNQAGFWLDSIWLALLIAGHHQTLICWLGCLSDWQSSLWSQLVFWWIGIWSVSTCICSYQSDKRAFSIVFDFRDHCWFALGIPQE